MPLRYASEVVIYKYGDSDGPAEYNDIPASPGDLWVDVSSGTPVLKICAGANPWIWNPVLGAVLLNGAVAPTIEGNNGDYYIDSVTNTIYGPKANDVWPAGVSMIGPTGPAAVTARSLTVQIDGGTSTPATGIKARWSSPAACTVTGWTLVADASGDAVIDVLRGTYAAFPTTASIAGTDKPTLSTAQKNENLGPLTLWGSTAIAAGDVLEFDLASVTTCKILSLTLNLTVP